MANKECFFEDRIQDHFQKQRYKQLSCVLPSNAHRNKVLDFTSQDFLCLAEHDFVKKATIRSVLKWGAGSTTARILTEHIEGHKALEEKLARAMKTEDAQLFSSPFQAHSLILSTLTSKNTILFIDRYAAPDLVRSAQNSHAKIIRFEHNNVADLERELARFSHVKPHQKIIITESIFSTTGKQAPLTKLIELADAMNALLYVDDSLSVGVYGRNGLGLCSERSGIDIAVGSFGKSGGCFGAYAGISSTLKEYLQLFSAGLSCTTPLPPALLGAIETALTLIPDMHEERRHIAECSDKLRDALRSLNMDCGHCDTHIIPLLFHEDKTTAKLSEFLEKNNIFIQLLLPPQVPQGHPRLRLAVTAEHKLKDINRLAEILEQAGKLLPLEAPPLVGSYIL